MNDMEILSMKVLARQIRGVSYKPEDLHDGPDGSSIMLLRANNIGDGKINFDEVVYVDRARVSQEQLLRKNDILICASSGSKSLVGKAATFDFDKEVTFGAFCKVVRPNDTENKEYISMFFQSPHYRHEISTVAIGANINNIRNEHIDVLQVRWPSSEIRKRAVTILSKTDKIIRCRKEEQRELDDLIKARFVEMFGYCAERKRLEEYASLITKGASPKWQGLDYCDEGTLFVTSENVREGYVDLSKRKYLPDKINGILPRSVLCRNDVLINIVGASIGRAAVFQSDELANINQAVALVRIKENVLNLQFLITFLNSIEAQKAYGFMKKGGARDNLSLKNISDLEIPVADMNQQEEFAAFVAQVDKSKVAIQKALDEAQLLFDNLMQQYFG